MNIARFLVPFFALVMVGTAACDGCSDDPADADANERVEQLASHLPATTDLAVVAPNIGELSRHLDYAIERADHFPVDARAFENGVNRSLGFRITDIESWEAAGFATEGALMFSMVGARPVLAAHLDDENSFQTHVVGQLREQFHAETPIDNQDFGDRTFRISGQGLSDDMAWYVDDSVVVLIMPPFEAFNVFESGSATSVANKLGELSDDVTLAESEPFDEYLDAVGIDYPVSIYFDAERTLDRPAVEHDQIGGTGINMLTRNLTEWARMNADTGGIGFRAGDGSIVIDGFVGGDDDVIEEARGAFSTGADVDFDGFLTENTTVALRTAADPNRLLEIYLSNLPDDERDAMERELSQIEHNHNLDLNEDVLGAFSGHSLLVFYGIVSDAGQALPTAMAGQYFEAIQTALSNAGLMVNFHFADEDKKNHLFEHALGFGNDFVNQRQLVYDDSPVDEFEVIEPTNSNMLPLRLYSGTDTATVSTTGIDESSAYEYFTDQRSESRLFDAEDLQLGAEFAESDDLNGLYVNFGNLATNLRQLGGPIGTYAGVLDPIDEFLITAGIEDDGLYTRTKLTFSAPLEAN